MGWISHAVDRKEKICYIVTEMNIVPCAVRKPEKSSRVGR